MYNFLKILVSYFRTIEIYEVHNRSSFKALKKYEFKIYKKFSSIRSKNILEYFNIYNEKKKRFTKNCFFLTLSLKKKLVSSGWLYKGKRWKISEIDRKINVINKLVIFDFITPLKYRNKGYYTKLLKFIRTKFKNKNILIYSLSSNKKSIRAIVKAGFICKKKIKK